MRVVEDSHVSRADLAANGYYPLAILKGGLHGLIPDSEDPEGAYGQDREDEEEDGEYKQAKFWPG